jgi:saccharopine dehydrogenase (NAD+, L-lysine-forming)
MSPHRIGIRREDKSRWEARAPLTPEDIRELTKAGLAFDVQKSPLRRFSNEAYAEAGARVTELLGDCSVILGVKEMPVPFFQPEKTYVFFSHTIKAQPANMPMLRRIVELGCTLIDYERITDDKNRRLVFFGRYAGLAGMIDTLWALGQRLKLEGVTSPFEDVQRAYDYEDLEAAKRAITLVGERIRRDGLPAEVQPLVCGFAGYGNVSRGAQEIYDLLPTHTIAPDEVSSVRKDKHTCFKTVYYEQDLVRPKPAAGVNVFELQDYYDHPDRYVSCFHEHLPHLTLLVNCIYWEPKYPRLVSNDDLKSLWSAGEKPRLRVIGDITCDIEGSIECTVRPADPGEPTYVYAPVTGEVADGLAGAGPVILAVDILPCELPADSSAHFGKALRPFIPALAQADFTRPLAQSGLPAELQRATIVYRGALTPPYEYLQGKF